MMLAPAPSVLALARALLPVREAGQNRGRFVEAIIRFAGGEPGEPWCASFVYYCGRKMLGEGWRLPKTRSCDVLLNACKGLGMLSTAPQSGGLFFVMRTPADATHVGFVDQVLPDGRFTTVEGNSNDKGHRDGDGVVANVRGTTGTTVYQFTAPVA